MIRGIGLLVCLLVISPSLARSYQIFEENGKVGMKDDAGRVVLPPCFEALGWSDGNFSVVGEVTGYRLQGAWGIINLKKEFITKAEYESLVYCGGEGIAARKKINIGVSKAGCINLKGETKIPFIYDGIVVQGLRAIVFNLKGARYRYGLVDINNKVLIPPVYNDVKPLGTLRFAVENAERKIAIFNDEGTPITSFSIDSVSSFFRNFAIIYQNHLRGLIDREGILRLEVKYKAIDIDQEGKVFAQLPDEWLYLNGKNELQKQILADDLTPINETRMIICRGKAFGLIDQDLRTVIQIAYEDLSEISPGRYRARNNARFGIISESEKIIVPLAYDSLTEENNHYRAYKKNLGWQLLDADGKILTDRYYQHLSSANPLGYRCEHKNFAGMIDAEGREFIHCVFDSIAVPRAGLMAVKFKGKYGIINEREDWLVAPQQFPLYVINDQRYLLKQPGNNFIKSFTGEILYFTPYLMKFGIENFIEFLPDGTEKTVSYQGEILQRLSLPEGGKTLFRESEGLRGILKDGHYGFLDSRGRLRIANRYDSIGEFHEALAAVKLIGKWGFVNTDDQIVINPNYDNCSFFDNGLAIVSRNKKFGLIGPTGNVMLPLRYDGITRLHDHKFLLFSNSLTGLSDEKGNVLIEPRFTSLTEAVNDLLVACRDSKCGAISNQGVGIIPTVYDRLISIPSKGMFLAERKSAWKEMDLQH